jgi:hypothetical protein
MPQERWQPSAGLKVAGMADGLVRLGFTYLIVRFFFPHVFLVPVMIIAGMLYVAEGLTRFRVLLDRAVGEVAITTGLWTKRVPLIRVERAEEIFRIGAEIKLVGGKSFGYNPLRKRRRLAPLLKLRTGFEGMELAITQAAVAACIDDPAGAAAARPSAKSQNDILAGSVAFGVSVIAAAVAVAVQPQAGGWLVHSLAVLLQVYFGLGCAVGVLISTGILYSAVRDRHYRALRDRHLARQQRRA